MTAPLSQDPRERIVHAVEGGGSARSAAKRLEVSASAAIKGMERVREAASMAPAEIGGRRRPIREPHAVTGRALAMVKGAPTLKEVWAALNARGIEVKALSTIADMLHRLGLSSLRAADASTGSAGPPRRRPPPRALPCLAALQGRRALRVPGRDRRQCVHATWQQVVRLNP